MIFLTLYIILSLSITASAWASAGLSGGISLLTIALIAFCSGAGLRGSFYYSYQQISAATMAAIVCMAIATWIGQGFTAQVFGVELTGSLWGWIGFAASFALNPGNSRKWTALRSI